MKYIFAFLFALLAFSDVTYADNVRVDIAPITETSATIFIEGSNILKKENSTPLSASVLNVPLIGSISNIPITPQCDQQNECSFAKSGLVIPGLTCNTSYTALVRVNNSQLPAQINRPFKTRSCPTVPPAVSPFKIDIKLSQGGVTATGAAVTAEISPISPSIQTVSSATITYRKKGSSTTPISSTLASSQGLPNIQVFTRLLSGLTCNTEYEIKPFVTYGSPAITQTSNLTYFKTATCPIVAPAISPFKITNKETQSISKTSANVSAEVLKVPPSTEEVTAAGFFYGKKGVSLASSSPSSLALLSTTNRAFGLILNNLFCGTSYQFKAYIRYGTSPKPEYGDLGEFTTLACDPSSQITDGRIIFKRAIVKSDSADISFEVTNDTLFELKPYLSWKNKIDASFSNTKQHAFDTVPPKTKKNLTFTIPALSVNTEYQYKVKSTFFVVGSGEEGKPIENSSNQGFKTLLAGNRILEVETVEAVQNETALKLEGRLKDGYTNPISPDFIHTWFKVRKKGQNEYEWKVAGENKLIGNIFSYPYAGTFTGMGCEELEYQASAQYNSTLIDAGFKPINNFGALNLIEVSNTPNSSATGEIKMFRGGSDCTKPSVTPGGGGSNNTEGSDIYTFITPLPLGENQSLKNSIEIGQGGIIDLINRMFTLMLVVAVVLAVVFMIIGGSRYATGDSLGSIGGGKEIITNAIKGLLFALLAWLLLNLINPDLLRFSLELENKGVVGTGTISTGSSGNAGNGSTANTTELAQFIMDAYDNGLWADYETSTGNESTAASLDAEIKVILKSKGKEAACGRRSGKCVLYISYATGNHFSVYDKDTYTQTSGKVCTPSTYQTECAPIQNIPASCCTVAAFTGSGSGDGSNGTLKTYKTCTGQTTTNSQCYLQKDTNQKIAALKAKQSSMRITEAWPPSFAGHSSTPCHQFGTCIDAVITGSASTGGGQSGVVGQGDKKITNQLDYVFTEFNMSGGVRDATEYGSVTIKAKLAGAAKWVAPISQAAASVGIDKRLLGTIVAIESDGVPGQTSSAQIPAYGLVQMQAATAVSMAKKLGNTITESEAKRILLSSTDADVLFSMKIAARYLKEIKANQSRFQDILAGYNAGYGTNSMGPSTNCPPGRKRWECPWESGTVAGGDLCYDKNNPKKPLKTDCSLNADRGEGSFEEARFYVVNGTRIYNQASQFE